MTPRRWRDPDGGAPEGAHALLEAARKSRPMTAAERERSTKRVARLAAVPVAVGLLATLKGLAAAAGIGAGSALVLIGAFTLVEAQLESTPAATSPANGGRMSQDPAATSVPAGSSASPAEVRPSPPAPPVPAETAPAYEPAGGGSAAAPPGPDPEARGAPVGAASTASAPSIATSSGEVDSLLQEVELLEQARALVATSPALGLARLEEHARRFPAGKLSVEREFLVIDALHRLGREGEANARGKALLSRAAGSSYEKRVKEQLGITP